MLSAKRERERERERERACSACVYSFVSEWVLDLNTYIDCHKYGNAVRGGESKRHVYTHVIYVACLD